MVRGLLVVVGGQLLVLVGEPDMGSGDGKSGGVELVFEVFGEVEAG